MESTKFSYVVIRAFLVVLLLALSGCVFTQLMTSRFENPTFTYRGSELVEISQSRVIINFQFSAHNPNEAGLKNVTCSYELFVEGNKFLTGNDIPLTLNPKGDTDISVPATILYKDLFPALQSIVRLFFSDRKIIPITIVAVFSGKPATYSQAGKEKNISFEVKLTRAVDIPLPQ